MTGDADIAAAAALLSDPTRAKLLLAVIDEGALPTSELAGQAGISLSTASEHLAKLAEGGFVVTHKAGRQRYYGVATPAVAAAVEALAVVAPRMTVKSLREATRSELLREARTCYDHLAGHLGVALARGMERERVVIRNDGNYTIGPSAGVWLGSLDIDLKELKQRRRPLVRCCLDWSEGEFHVAGTLGAAVTQRLVELGWIRRRKGNRSVEVTAKGAESLSSELGVDPPRGNACS